MGAANYRGGVRGRAAATALTGFAVLVADGFALLYAGAEEPFYGGVRRRDVLMLIGLPAVGSVVLVGLALRLRAGGRAAWWAFGLQTLFAAWLAWLYLDEAWSPFPG